MGGGLHILQHFKKAKGKKGITHVAYGERFRKRFQFQTSDIAFLYIPFS